MQNENDSDQDRTYGIDSQVLGTVNTDEFLKIIKMNGGTSVSDRLGENLPHQMVVRACFSRDQSRGAKPTLTINLSRD